MGVFIKGMEMPNRCFECIFLTTAPSFFCLAGKKDLCAEHGINISRPDWCPLIELPPHGRMIDADAFEDAFNMELLPILINKYGEDEALKGLHFSFRDCICNIQTQKTVIEAEGSET